jgi:uncharacterized protein YejL (UPF0352 family)
MWLNGHGKNAQRMKESSGKEHELDIPEKLTTISRPKSLRDAPKPQRRVFRENITPEQKAVLQKHGASTSLAAKELGWSIPKVQLYAVELGIVDSSVFISRKGKRGRPRSANSVVNSNQKATNSGQTRRGRPSTLCITPEQEAILRKHGASTSLAAKELGWSIPKVQRYAVELGIVDSNVFISRKGKTGRPRSANSVVNSNQKATNSGQTRRGRPSTLCITPEQEAILRKHEASTSLAAKELGWSIPKVQRYAVELGIVDSSVFISRKGKRGRPRSASSVVNSNQKATDSGQTRRGRPSTLGITPEQKAILSKHGASTSLAAKELGWSIQKVQRYALELGIVDSGVIFSRKEKQRGIARQSSLEIDELMHRYGRQLKKVASLIGWSVSEVSSRMNMLGITRESDEVRILKLLEVHDGCVKQVAALTQRTTSFINKLRVRCGSKATMRRSSTHAWDNYISLILNLSHRKVKIYLILLMKCLPEKISSEKMSYVTGICRKTIDKYFKEEWLPSDRREFVMFLESQIAFASNKNIPASRPLTPSSKVLDLEVLHQRASSATNCSDLQQEIVNDAVVRVLSGYGNENTINLEVSRVQKTFYPSWGHGSDSFALRSHNDNN